MQSDYNTAVNSINLGQPLVESDPASRISTEIREIAASVTGAVAPSQVTEPRRTLWQSIFGRAVGKTSNEGLNARIGRAAV